MKTKNRAKSKPRTSKRTILTAHRVTGKGLVIDGRKLDKNEQDIYAVIKLTEYR